MAGASLPTDRKLDGANMLPYLSGAKRGSPDRPLFTKNGTCSQVIKDDWKLIWDQQLNKKWLFDLKSDPIEQNNLVDQSNEKSKLLTELLAAFIAEQPKPIWEGSCKSPIYIDKHLNEVCTNTDEYTYWQN